MFRSIPARYGYGTNPRVPPIVCLADRGWYFATASALKKRLAEHPRDGGAHGYDPFDPTMRAVFVAHGPASGSIQKDLPPRARSITPPKPFCLANS